MVGIPIELSSGGERIGSKTTGALDERAEPIGASVNGVWTGTLHRTHQHHSHGGELDIASLGNRHEIAIGELNVGSPGNRIFQANLLPRRIIRNTRVSDFNFVARIGRGT